MNIVFDTEAILAFFLGEEGAGTVERYLRTIEIGRLRGYMSTVNLSEIYYILYRIDPRVAEDKFKVITESKIVLVQPDVGIAKDAGEVKGKHSLSLADAFAVATAKAKKGKLLVGRDRELGGLKDIKIERIR